jgi:hypothetical protein
MNNSSSGNKMSIETSSVASSNMSIESEASFTTEMEDMLVSTQHIIEKLDATEAFLKGFSMPTYYIKTPDKESSLKDVLDILQSVSKPETFGSNMLAFLQNSQILVK